MKSKVNRYTVVGVYPDEGETFVEKVEATTARGAIGAFWKTRDDEDTGISVVAVFEGWVVSLMRSACWVDHPKAHVGEEA